MRLSIEPMESESISISVIVPAYNAGKWIVRTLDSIANQTLSPLEIIVVDDASTDDTPVRVLNWLRNSNQNNVHLHRFDSNQGVAAARNFGLHLSTCQYVAFMDADDTWSPSKLKLQYEYLIQNPLVIAVGCDYTTQRDGIAIQEVSVDWSRHSMWEWLTLCRPGMLLTSTFLVKREFALSIDGFDETLSTAADTDFALRLSALGSFGQVSQSLAQYHLSEGQMHRDLDKLSEDLKRIWSKTDFETWPRHNRALTTLNLSYLRIRANTDTAGSKVWLISTTASLFLAKPLLSIHLALIKARIYFRKLRSIRQHK